MQSVLPLKSKTKRIGYLLLAGFLFICQLAIDLNRDACIAYYQKVSPQLPKLLTLQIGLEPLVMVLFFTLVRAAIYTKILEWITQSKEYSRLFLVAHILLFALSAFLLLLKKGFHDLLGIPPKIYQTLFLLTNTPFLFLAFLPAYYYLFRKSTEAK